ncbi:MAG: peptidylprolyl isomerase [Acidobacteria bacterium]|nr:peptidylprolyl isomerase [Acidobacteriota bacterium]
MKLISYLSIYLSLMAMVCSSVNAQSKRAEAPAPQAIYARIIQLEDERNFNDELKGLLKHRSAPGRERAALAIGRIGDKRGTDALIDVLRKDEDRSARAMAAFALGEIEDPEAVDALLEVVNASKEALSIRARAVEALGKIAGVHASAEKLGQKTLDSINQELVNRLSETSPEPSEDGKLLASLTITALMRLRNPASVEPLTRQLKSKDADIRAQAANALARLRQPIGSAVPALIETLDDGDADLRANAARALGVSKDGRAVEPLIGLLDDDNDRVQVGAVRALASLSDRRAVEPLIELAKLSDPKVTIRRQRLPNFNLLLECVSALGALKDERAIPLLVERRGAYAPTAIQEVEIAIAKFGERKFREIPPSPTDQRDMGCQDWKRASATALAISEILPTKESNVWERVMYTLLFTFRNLDSPACDQRSRPARLRAINKLALNYLAEPSFAESFKSKDVAPTNLKFDPFLSYFPPHLKEKDIIVRATVATIMAEQPRDTHLAPLLEALAESKNDPANDARLAILTALSKNKKPEAIDAIKTALTDSDHLVRRHAVDLLKQMGMGDFSDRIGIVQTGHNKLFYQRVVARLNKKVTATIHTDKGQIRLQLFPQDAPITVDSFISLARKGYFNNLTFHRVVPNFVIQGGDPRGDGEGGPGYQIRCEINARPYTRGAVGMALSGKDTGGSQFFITHSPQPHLDGGYTVFGQVVSGMEVVDRIARGDLIKKIEIFEVR